MKDAQSFKGYEIDTMCGGLNDHWKQQFKDVMMRIDAEIHSIQSKQKSFISAIFSFWRHQFQLHQYP